MAQWQYGISGYYIGSTNYCSLVALRRLMYEIGLINIYWCVREWPCYLDATAASINSDMSLVGVGGNNIGLGVKGLSADPVEGDSGGSGNAGEDGGLPVVSMGDWGVGV